MTKEELIDRINDIEWEDFEAKEAKSELPKNIWETVSAFANTSGGWIVLGVKQNGKKFEISGVGNAEKLEQDFLGTLRSQKFNEPVDAKSMLYHIDGHKVLAFHIASSPHKPIYYNNPQNTFIRFGSGDQRATNGEITAMFHNQSFGIKSEQILLDSNLSMLNEDTIRDYRNYFKLYSPRPNLIGNDIADFCKRIGITDNEGHLNYGGLMCFGKEEWVRHYVPTFWMDLVEIPGRSVREARTRYTYRIPEQENLWEYFQIMIRRLRLIVDTPFMMNDEGFNVEDRSQFKILREALVNMLSHFDPFSTIHSCIHIYTDRVNDRVINNNEIYYILNFCREPKTRREIFECIGLVYHSDAFKAHIKPLINFGYLALTIPDKPNSRLQKNKLTEKGKGLLVSLK